MPTVFKLEDLNDRDHLGNLGVDRIIILKCILKVLTVDVDWINLAQNRDEWRGLVNNAKNLRSPKRVGNFLTS